jgi:hypothetical protein
MTLVKALLLTDEEQPIRAALINKLGKAKSNRLSSVAGQSRKESRSGEILPSLSTGEGWEPPLGDR